MTRWASSRVPVATSPLDGIHTMARMAGGIDVDHPPTPSRWREDRSHCSDDPEQVYPDIEREEGEGLHGGTPPQSQGQAFFGK
jgi:hypothetical protein